MPRYSDLQHGIAREGTTSAHLPDISAYYFAPHTAFADTAEVRSEEAYRGKAMNLPIELWMRVFEHLTLDHVCARENITCNFLRAIDWDAAQKLKVPHFEEKCVRELPGFELQAWKTTRSYYAVNRTSRAAALRLCLTNMLLRICPAPLRLLPFGIPDEDRQEFTAQRSAAMTSGRLALELFNPELLAHLRNLRLKTMPAATQRVCLEAFTGGPLPFIDALNKHMKQLYAAAGDAGFGAVREIDVLTYVPIEPRMLTESVPGNVTALVRRAWKANGRRDGVVRIWED